MAALFLPCFIFFFGFLCFSFGLLSCFFPPESRHTVLRVPIWDKKRRLSHYKFEIWVYSWYEKQKREAKV